MEENSHNRPAPEFRPRQGRGRQPKFNIYWIYAIILAGLVAANMFPGKNGGSREISWTKMEEYISAGYIQQATCISNKNEVELNVRKEALKEVFGEDVKMNNPPILTVKIPSADEFNSYVGQVRKDNPTLEMEVTYKEGSNLLVSLLVNLGPFILLILLWIFLMRRMSGGPAGGGGGGNIFSVGKSQARLFDKGSANRVTFKDVAGLAEAKQEVEEIVSFLKNPAKYTELGGKIPKGALLVGPPGTGKTLLARAVAGEAEVQFLSISGSDFVELYVGVGAGRVRDLFEQAKKMAPAIIFIDEIDAVGRHRGAGLGGGHDEREQTLNQLLVEMDGFTGNTGVIVMAATNRKDILDPALLRPGRFDRQIYIGKPDCQGREDILKVHARGKPLADTVNLHIVARATVGFTGADLENLLNEGALLAARANRPCILMEDLEEAMLKVSYGPQKKSHKVSERTKRLTAYHEAGHAVSAWYLPHHPPVQMVTTIPRGPAGGLTMFLPEEDQDDTSRSEMFEHIVSALGGRIAESFKMDDISTGASADIQQATAIAHEMVTRYGMSEALGTVRYGDDEEVFVGMSYGRTRPYSDSTAGKIDDEVRRLIDLAYEQGEQILKEHDDKLEAVAQYLLSHETMTRMQFSACMKGEPIPENESESIFEHFAELEKQEQEKKTEESSEIRSEDEGSV